MKHILLVLIPLILCSCQSASPDSTPTTDGAESPNTPQAAATRVHDTKMAQSPTTRFQYYRDQKSGLIQYRTPLPADWLMHQEPHAPYFITGPQELKVSQPQMEEYVYSQDPFTLQSLQMTGKQISPVYSLEQILEQHLKPSAQSQGYTFIQAYPLPKVQAFWDKFAAGMLQTGTHRQYQVMGSEWKDAGGNHSLMVQVQSITQNGASILWSLNSTELEAPKDYFEKAKNAYLEGIAQTEINPQWQQYMNGKLMGQIQENNAFWAQKSAESAQAHQQRMAAIQARGQAARNIGDTYSEILDINHAGYLNRSSMVDAGQANTVDMIQGHALISHPSTDETYKVQDNSRYFWVNQRGEYIGTDNPLYDPRIDNRINGEGWEKFELTRH